MLRASLDAVASAQPQPDVLAGSGVTVLCETEPVVRRPRRIRGVACSICGSPPGRRIPDRCPVCLSHRDYFRPLY